MDQALYVFITVAEQQNFTRAAEMLHMTQPAVSNHIHSLERSLNIKLLERTNKYVRLNEAGEIVYHHAKDILNLHTRMENLLDDLKNTVSGTLSIGASYTYGEYVLPYKISTLLQSYPLLNPNITIRNTNEIIDLMMHHQIDVGIIEGEMTNESLNITPFAQDQLSVIAAANHPLFSKKTINLQDLHHERWLVREEGSGTLEKQQKCFKQLDFYPKNEMTLGSTQVIKESIEAGLGISLLSHLTIKKELALGRLKLAKIDGFPMIRHFSLVTPNVPFQTKATEVLVDLLIN
ncbi:LysR family transcriptional regulator [Sporolactobacillus inulinus]|uniref:Transcriptional regulator n=1 Tax=Sporolactobacillus inulinus CASD TaxID=1069536 RepID=A0A0U1QPR3_9BACL|nr:LysR family transcriptional regulator [Sporolactobacillus inulinus]KLI02791.1 transcriptional regulator [Sporolactobacillus inulinus CASD]GEB78485.1 LysR family transcriptional regulator [Sporolactobacillus inulinus]